MDELIEKLLSRDPAFTYLTLNGLLTGCYSALYPNYSSNFKKLITAISKNTTLKSLSLFDNDLSKLEPKHFAMLMQCIATHPTIISLHLCRTSIDELHPEDFKQLLQMLSHCKLEDIDLSNSGIENLEFAHLAAVIEIISRHTTLKKVQFSRFQSKELLELFLKNIQFAKNLTSINLDYCHLHKLPFESFKKFIDYLFLDSNLSSINLNGIHLTEFSEECFLYFVEVLKRCSKLKFIALAATHIPELSSRKINLLLEVLNNHPTLKEVYLDGLKIHDFEAEKLSEKSKEFLSSLSQEQKTQLESPSQSKPTPAPYAIDGQSFITEMKKRKVFDAKARADREEKESIEEYARHCHWYPILFGKEPVGHFEIKDREIHKKEAFALALGIKQNRTIKSLTLINNLDSPNGMTPAGMNAIIDAIDENQGINFINIDTNKLTTLLAKRFAEVISNHTGIKNLIITRSNAVYGYYYDYNDDIFRSLETFIKNLNLKFLNSLSLSYNRFRLPYPHELGWPVMQYLAPALLNPRNSLTRLDLSGNYFKEEETTLFASCLKANETITYLDLQNCAIQQKGIRAFCSVFLENRTLQELSIGENPFLLVEESVSYFLDSLMKNTSLTRLDLGGSKILFSENGPLRFSDRNFAKLIDLLSKGNITDIGLCKFSLEGNKLKMLTDFLASEQCNLTSLNLRACSLKDEEIIQIANAMYLKSKIKKLFLSSNKIQDEGAIAVARLLESQSQLEILDISENQVTEIGFKALAEALSINKTLQQVKLGQGVQEAHFSQRIIKINEALAKIFAKALFQNLNLQYLDLSRCRFSTEAIATIADAIAKSKTLAEIVLSDCGFDKASLRLLAEAFKLNQSLTNAYLNDQFNFWDFEKDRIILKALKHNTTIIKPFRYGIRGSQFEKFLIKKIESYRMRNQALLGRYEALLENIQNWRYNPKQKKESIKSTESTSSSITKMVDAAKVLSLPQLKEQLKKQYEDFLKRIEKLEKDGYRNELKIESLKNLLALSYCSHEITPLSKMERLNWIERLFKKPNDEDFKKAALPLLADLHWAIAEEMIARMPSIETKETKADKESIKDLTKNNGIEESKEATDAKESKEIPENIKHHLLSAYICSTLSPKNEFMEKMADLCLEYIVTHLGNKTEITRFIHWDSSLEEKLMALMEHDRKTYEEFQLSCQQHCKALFLNPNHFAIAKEASTLSLSSETPIRAPLRLTQFEEEKEHKEGKEGKDCKEREESKEPLSRVLWLYQSKISLRLPESSEREKPKPIKRPEKPQTPTG